MRFKTLALLLIGLCVTMEAAAQFHGRARIRSYSNYRSYLRADPVASGRKKPFQRFGIGLSYTSAPATFKYQVRDNLSDYDSLKSISSNGYGLGGLITFTVPVVRTGMKGLIGVHIGINYMTYIYPSEEKMVVKKSTQYYNGTYTYSGSGGGMMIGVPVGLDMISGGEASLNREDRISFSLGGGLFPMLGVAVFNEFAGAKLAAPFYAKAEFGVHWGINWKLRATYITKSPTSFSENRYDILTNDFPVAGEFQANDQLIFSLFVQPFSFGWE